MKSDPRFHGYFSMYVKEIHYYEKIPYTGFSWCTKCGLLLEAFTEVVPKQVTSRKEGIFFLRFRTRSCRSFNPVNLRAVEHEHDWKRLSLNQSWCKICGAREIVRRRYVGTEFRFSRTILLPLRRVVRMQILQEANLI